MQNYIVVYIELSSNSAQITRVSLYIVIEVYATNHGYMTKEEFKKRKKEVNQDYAGDMPLSDLEAYEKAHHVPSLAPEMRQLIKKMNEKKSKK